MPRNANDSLAADDATLDKVVYTQHALERFIQRTRKKYSRHFDRCVSHNCHTCLILNRQASVELQERHAEVVEQFNRLFWGSKELLGEKRLELRGRIQPGMRFFRKGRPVFVISTENRYPTVVTCYHFRQWEHSSHGREIKD